MTELQGNSTADDPRIIWSNGTICPNVRHVEASLYPQAGKFNLPREGKSQINHKLFNGTGSLSLSFCKMLKRCDHCVWSEESLGGKLEVIKTTESRSVFLKSLTIALFTARSRLKNQSICVRKTKTLINLQQGILLLSLNVKLLQWVSSREGSSKSLGAVQGRACQWRCAMLKDRLASEKCRNEEF